MGIISLKCRPNSHSAGGAMCRRVVPLLLVLLAASSSAVGQVGLARPQRCRVRILVTTDQQERIKDVNVELMDALGFSSATSTKITGLPYRLSRRKPGVALVVAM